MGERISLRVYPFTGKEDDLAVGLTYFGKRYLIPALGRWASPDPLAVHSPGSADLNLYAYVRGQLLRATDPTGLVDEQRDGSRGAPAAGDATQGGPSGASTSMLDAFAEAWQSVRVAATRAIFSEESARNLEAGKKLERKGPDGAADAMSGAVVDGTPAAAANVWMVMAGNLGAKGPAPTKDATATGAMEGKSVGAAAAADPAIQVGPLNKQGDPYVEAGEGGSFRDLKARAKVGDAITPHHMPQKAQGFTSEAEGGCVTCLHKEHVQTRTYGSRGATVLEQEAGLPFRTVLARDIRDLRQVAGTKYDPGIRRMLEYYHDQFPALMAKPKIEVGGSF